ncbi:MAG: hypothetical protein HY399_04320 [Elusimicrobia bacterium]|nr:hypothetical protein [Elusimicrobiota bacterium]
METYYAICVGLATLAITAGVVFLVSTLLQLRKTALKVEEMAKHLDEHAERFRNVSTAIQGFSEGVQSGWGKGAQFLVGLATTIKESLSQKTKNKRNKSN